MREYNNFLHSTGFSRFNPIFYSIHASLADYVRFNTDSRKSHVGRGTKLKQQPLLLCIAA